MKKILNIPHILLVINILTLILIAVILLLPHNALRIVLGLPFMLFIPGYVLSLALFPSKQSLGALERTALSFGLSIASVILTGLVLKYTPWSVGVYSMLYALSLFVALVSLVAGWRWRKLPPENRLSLSFQFAWPYWSGFSRPDRILSITLGILAVGIIGVLCYGYTAVIPDKGERFSEFYVVSAGGQAADYPTTLTIGEESSVVIGVSNHEGAETAYTIKLSIDGVQSGDAIALTLAPGDKREQEISFIAQKAGSGQKVEFSLYEDNAAEPYATLYFYIDVT